MTATVRDIGTPHLTQGHVGWQPSRHLCSLLGTSRHAGDAAVLATAEYTVSQAAEQVVALMRDALAEACSSGKHSN